MGVEKRWAVLYFDDSALTLEATKFGFEDTEIALSTASDLGELQTQLDERSYDLILLDVETPELFGDDVGSIMRGSRGLTVPIYLYSSLDKLELSARAKEAGLDGFICKDVGLPGLIEKVQALLAAKA